MPKYQAVMTEPERQYHARVLVEKSGTIFCTSVADAIRVAAIGNELEAMREANKQLVEACKQLLAVGSFRINGEHAESVATNAAELVYRVLESNAEKISKLSR